MVPSLCREDPLEDETATHCSILAWRIPWTEEPGGLEFIGLQRDTTEATYCAYLHNDATHTSKISETDPSE